MNGGTLVVFPTIAQYDEGGKPYPTHPGAGFDELLGFTTDPNWRMGRSQVELPGENAARKAFEEAWLRGDQGGKSEKPTARTQPPLFFNLGPRIGGHPCHYMPEGRQRLTNLAKDVVVIGRHQDGNPLLTYRKVGKGEAICFNVLLTGECGLAEPATEATETFRQIIDHLVHCCGVTPEFEFENTRAYGEGISEFVTMRYDLPGTSTRILTLFADYRGRRADARLRLRPPFTDAYDVLNGEKLVTMVNPAEKAPEAVVVVKPGYWRVLALTTSPLKAPALAGPNEAVLGESPTSCPRARALRAQESCGSRLRQLSRATGGPRQCASTWLGKAPCATRPTTMRPPWTRSYPSVTSGAGAAGAACERRRRGGVNTDRISCQ
ncbi:MAG: hypothetical protein AMK72_05080 [Planctomycetes bacterium SM23_25]|nr:MAG: hypothetical protein AMK72_05080 [Planctomycetes bacterium SM23_25]